MRIWADYRISGNWGDGAIFARGNDGGIMKTSKRFLFGVLSSLLLAVGFAHAADRIDPMNTKASLSSIDASKAEPLKAKGNTPCIIIEPPQN